jgi:hypothetical protein
MKFFGAVIATGQIHGVAERPFVLAIEQNVLDVISDC